MSNFAIGLVEAVTVRSSTPAAAAGTSANYPFNAEPGLIYRSNATIANGGFAQWKLDLGSSKAINLLAMFGLPAVASQIQAFGFTSSANQDAETPAFNSGGFTAPLSANRTASKAKALAMFNANGDAYRYWTVYWYNQSGSAQTLDVSRIALCEAFQPADNVEWGLRFDIEDTSKLEVSETGYDDVEEQRVLPVMSGVIPWGQVAELPYMQRLLFRSGTSREIVASLDPSDTTWGEDSTIWGRFRQGPALTLVDYDVNQLEFSIKAIMP